MVCEVCDGQESVEDEKQMGHSMISQPEENIEKVCAVLQADHRQMIRMFANHMSINKETVRHILTWNLCFKKIVHMLRCATCFDY